MHLVHWILLFTSIIQSFPTYKFRRRQEVVLFRVIKMKSTEYDNGISEVSLTKNIPTVHKKSQSSRSILLTLAETTNPSILSDCVWLLGDMRFKLKESSIVPISEKVKSLLESTYRMTEIDTAKLFIGFAKLQYDLDVKAESFGNLKTILMNLIENNIQYLGARGFSNAIWSMSKIGITKSDMSPSLRRNIFKAIYLLCSSNDLNDQALSMTISSLFKFNYSWNK